MPTPSWDLYEAFLHVMREGSFSGASRSLRVVQPTVRRRIAALEAALGRPLFTRSPNGLLPTAAAQRVLAFAETMEAASRSLVRSVADPDSVRGTVRIAASELVGAEVLPKLLAPLQREHPELALELTLSNDVANMTRRDADIAVRMAPPKGASLVARKIGEVHLGFYAAPAYLEGRPAPEQLTDLTGHHLVGYDTHPQLLDGLAALGLQLSPKDFRFRTDHDLAYLGAIRAGLGIGVTHVPLAEGLVRVLPEYDTPIATWLVVHEDLRAVRRIRIVLDHLASALKAYVG